MKAFLPKQGQTKTTRLPASSIWNQIVESLQQQLNTTNHSGLPEMTAYAFGHWY